MGGGQGDVLLLFSFKIYFLLLVTPPICTLPGDEFPNISNHQHRHGVHGRLRWSTPSCDYLAVAAPVLHECDLQAAMKRMSAVTAGVPLAPRPGDDGE